MTASALPRAPDTMCQSCHGKVPHTRAKMVLAFGMCCLACLPDVIGPRPG